MGLIRSRRDRLLTFRARRMRQAGTRAEAALWEALRDRRLGGWKWRRQAPVGPYIADFLCAEVRLVIELDGEAHAERGDYDLRRTAYLERTGLRVLRFSNDTVLADRSGVSAQILDACGGEVTPALAVGPWAGIR